MPGKESAPVRTLESGEIAFLFRPRVGEENPSGLQDVQRLYVTLRPEGRGGCRLLVIGRKRLPDPAEAGHARFWGYVDSVRARVADVRASLQAYTYPTKTRGRRYQPGARPAGEGAYRLLEHGDHTHLVYELRLPHTLGRMQEDLHVRPRASYVLVARNPEPPPEPGSDQALDSGLPAHLRARFRGRRFAPADPELLDVEGMELILIAAAEDFTEELGVDLADRANAPVG